MPVSKWDMMKFMNQYEDDIDFADFSPDEWQEKMEEFMSQTGRPLTVSEFKEKYFEFYDDVKDKSRKKQDW